MSPLMLPSDDCCNGSTGTADPVATIAANSCSNPTMAAATSRVKQSDCNREDNSDKKPDAHSAEPVRNEDGCCGGGDKGSSGVAVDQGSITEDSQAACCSANKSSKYVAVQDFCINACCSGGSGQPETTERAIQVDCQDVCCSGSDAITLAIAQEPNGKDGCCSGNDEEKANKKQDSVENDCQNACCSGMSTSQPSVVKNFYEDKCCSGSNEKTATRGKISACCEAKSTPCCDISCVDRLAARECESDYKRKGSSHKSPPDGAACASHKKRTHEKYSAKLAALECICRTLLALGQESCCVPKRQSFQDKRHERKKSTGCSKIPADCCKKQHPGSSRHGASGHCNTKSKVQGSACEYGCCEDLKDSKGGATRKIVEKKPSNDNSINVIRDRAPVGSGDLEKGTSGNEYIALSISGMTCTGCETKLQRVLGTVPAVTNLKTSLIMARAEFNLDTATMSPEGVIKHLERTTEFKCDRISTKGSVIEVLPRGDILGFMNQPLPLGVDNMQLVGKGAVRINFDPKVIGARDLMEHGLKYPSQLAPHTADQGLAAGSKHVRDIGCMTLLSIVLTIPVLVLGWAPIKSRPIPYGAISLALSTIIQFFVAGPFYPKALKSLIFSRMIEMDLLIVLSTSAAYIFSVVSFGFLVSGKPLSTGEFLETSTLLVSLIMVGRWLGALARQKAVESISIRSLQPFSAQLVTEDGIHIAEVDTRLLQFGDFFSVLPESRVPTDGIVMAGSSETDESMLTGESRPIEKEVGSKVIAGSINSSGKLTVQLTHLPGENTISTIAGMVDSAKLSKPKIQELADHAASHFVPVIVSLTIVTFVIWIGVGVAVQKKSGSEAAVQAITYAITVLIVSCPCAIGLAVPMVVVIGSGVAAEHGVIFKSADSMETAHKTTHVVFDKTGTLTEAKLKVLKEQYIAESTIAGRSVVLGLVANSRHPVSAAIAAHLTKHNTKPSQVDRIKTIAGKGIEGTVDAKAICGGNGRWLAVESDPRVQAILTEGYTLFCITLDSKLYAIYGLSDTVRPEAAATVAKLKQTGIQVSLLSGDDVGAVQHTAAQIGLSLDDARFRCSPKEKQEYIQELLESSVSKTKATVVFVGDGTNDAIALAQATIGVHMECGTDVAQSAADVVLMRPSLGGVLTTIEISRAAVRRIKFNFGWSFVYNVLALLFASGALVSANKGAAIRIPPQYAGLGELVSVLPVIGIAVGLKWAKF